MFLLLNDEECFALEFNFIKINILREEHGARNMYSAADGGGVLLQHQKICSMCYLLSNVNCEQLYQNTRKWMACTEFNNLNSLL